MIWRRGQREGSGVPAWPAFATGVGQQQAHARAPSRCRPCPAMLQEALPTPFGLVRSGVAPDHADTKVGRGVSAWQQRVH